MAFDRPTFVQGSELLTLDQFHDRCRTLSVTRSIPFFQAMVMVFMSYGYKNVAKFLERFTYS